MLIVARSNLASPRSRPALSLCSTIPGSRQWRLASEPWTGRPPGQEADPLLPIWVHAFLRHFPGSGSFDFRLTDPLFSFKG